jgi:hypothetical protein
MGVMQVDERSPSDRCPMPVAWLCAAWLALLVGAGLNAGWLFSALMKAGVQFREGPAAGIGSDETGRILAGVLAQPAFVAVFLFGLLAGPICAWLLMRLARIPGPSAARMRWAALTLLAAASVGAGQLVLARAIADRAMDRTEALVSGDAERAASARASLDQVHRVSEAAFGAQVFLVALGSLLSARPRLRRRTHG